MPQLSTIYGIFIYIILYDGLVPNLTLKAVSNASNF